MSRDRDDVKLGDIDHLNVDEPRRAPPRAGGEHGGERPRTPGEASRRAAPPAKRGGKSGGGWIALTLVLVLLLIAASGYFYLRISDLQARLDSRLSQSTEQLGDLRSRLSATGESSEALQATLTQHEKTLNEQDEQIRKLWDVSNKRNKGWIQDNQAAVKALRGDVKSNRQTLAELKKSIADSGEAARAARNQVAELGRRLDSAVKTLSADNDQWRTQISQLQTQLDVTVDTLKQLNEQNRSQQAALGKLQQSVADTADIKQRLNDVEAAIRAFDKYRLEVNRRLNQL